MPRKEYKTITVKKETAEIFFKTIRALRKRGDIVSNSGFMKRMLDEYGYVLKNGKK